MLNKDYANVTSAIGARTLQPAAYKSQPNWGVMLAQGLNAWNEKKAQEEQAQKLGAYSEALKSGNQDAINQAWAEYDPQGYSNYVNQQQQREQDRQWQLEDMARKERAAYGLAAYKNNLANIAANAERERENAQLDNALASGLITEAEYNQRKRMQILGDIVNGGDGKGSKYEFQSLLRETESPEFEQKPEVYKNLVRARLNYLSNAPENIFAKSYQGQRGKDVAAQEAANMQNAIENQQQYGKVDNAIALVESLPDDMFKPYTAASGYVGALTDGNVGMSAQDQQAYGELERTIGSLQNDLLQKARSKGQTGINTMSEIRQATKGLQYDRGKARLLGALKQLQSIEYKLDAMPTMMSVMPQGGIPSDADAFGDI